MGEHGGTNNTSYELDLGSKIVVHKTNTDKTKVVLLSLHISLYEGFSIIIKAYVIFAKMLTVKINRNDC